MSRTETTEYTDDGLSDAVKMFLTRHRDREGKYIYLEQIDGMMSRNSRHIVIDYNDLVSEPKIERLFHLDPDRILAAFSSAIVDVLKMRFSKYADAIKQDVQARIANFPLHRSLRQINAETIGRITSVSGMVVRASEVKPLAKELVYRCADNHITRVIQSQGISITVPTICSNPDCKHRSLEMKPKESRFIDFQILRLQELPEDLPPGQIPHYVDVNIKQDLVDNSRPGDRVILTGIVRIEQESVRNTAGGHSGLHRLRIEGNNIEFLGGRGGKTSRKIEREEISPDEEKIILAHVRSPDIYQKLVDSFAPHVAEHHHIKEAIMLLVVGSVQRQTPEGTKVRGDINVFLVGDPGTAKSEMLKFCSKVAPRGLYTSGRGSSAAGLTAAVIKDKSGMMMLEAGAVVLGDQGLVCIDELDKMRSEDRSALHEVMEQQTASIAKGGIVATLNARTSILAAANPEGGRYDIYRTIIDNVKIPIPLLTRFDLIFVIRDIPSAQRDERIARHILSRHTSRGTVGRSIIDPDMLTKYFAYAKRFEPEMTSEAESSILQYYLDRRKDENPENILSTPRQLEGIIRLATARARLLMKSRVDVEDAQRAIFLMDLMLQEAGYDKSNERVDLMVLHGKGSLQTNRVQLFMDIMQSLGGENNEPVAESALVEEMVNSDKFTAPEARKFIQRMSGDGIVYESKSGFYSKT